MEYNRLLKFMVSGGLSTIIHAAIVILMVENQYYGVELSNGVAYTVATIFNLILNTKWSFQKKITINLIWKYGMVSIIGLTAAMLISFFNRISGFNYVIGICLIVCICPAITYWLHVRVTYS